jgi:NTE family protein
MGNEPRTALVLSGGGARGAYQVGVLRGLMDLAVPPPHFDILVGSSAGAINAGGLAAYANDYAGGVDRLERVWSRIAPRQVFRTDVRSLGTTGARWAWDLTLGGAIGHVMPKSLLDTAPLRRLMAKQIPVRRIAANIESGALDALALAATDLYTAEGVVFLQMREKVREWQRRRWRIEPTQIGVDHLMASSAIPIFFPSVEIDGRYFGDGCIRNTSPLSPAINLGAERIIAIGTSSAHPSSGPPPRHDQPPSTAQIAGVLLDAVMLDAIEIDVAHSERVNDSVLECRTRNPLNAFRWVDVLWVQPSTSVAAVAAELEDRIPAIVRYLLRGLGSDDAITELASYLLFDAEFCGRLIEMGRNDVAASGRRVEAFLRRASGGTRAGARGQRATL